MTIFCSWQSSENFHSQLYFYDLFTSYFNLTRSSSSWSHLLGSSEFPALCRRRGFCWLRRFVSSCEADGMRVITSSSEVMVLCRNTPPAGRGWVAAPSEVVSRCEWRMEQEVVRRPAAVWAGGCRHRVGPWWSRSWARGQNLRLTRWSTVQPSPVVTSERTELSLQSSWSHWHWKFSRQIQLGGDHRVNQELTVGIIFPIWTWEGFEIHLEDLGRGTSGIPSCHPSPFKFYVKCLWVTWKVLYR